MKEFTEEELDGIAKLMEEIASMPSTQEPHVRQPGEKCMYEIQRIENRKQLQDMAKTNSPYYDP